MSFCTGHLKKLIYLVRWGGGGGGVGVKIRKKITSGLILSHFMILLSSPLTVSEALLLQLQSVYAVYVRPSVRPDLSGH